MFPSVFSAITEQNMYRPRIRIELFGTPRIVAGTRRIEATGDDLGTLVQNACEAVPSLRDHIVNSDGTWLNAGYTFVVDGQFTNDPYQSVDPDSDVLLVSRASGG
jgi:hypothetical protein